MLFSLIRVLVSEIPSANSRQSYLELGEDGHGTGWCYSQLVTSLNQAIFTFPIFLDPKGRQTQCRWREPPGVSPHPISPAIRLAALPPIGSREGFWLLGYRGFFTPGRGSISPSGFASQARLDYQP